MVLSANAIGAYESLVHWLLQLVLTSRNSSHIRVGPTADVAVANGFCTGNPSLTKVSAAHDFLSELGAHTTTKLRHILFTCQKFCVACQPSHCFAVFVHVSLPFSEGGISNFSLLCLRGRRCSRFLHPEPDQLSTDTCIAHASVL